MQHKENLPPIVQKTIIGIGGIAVIAETQLGLPLKILADVAIIALGSILVDKAEETSRQQG